MERGKRDENYFSQGRPILKWVSGNTLWGSPGGSIIKNPPANGSVCVQSLIPEDPIRREATKSCANHWACALELWIATIEPIRHNYPKPSRLELSSNGEATATRSHTLAMKSSSRRVTRERPAQQQRPSIAKNKQIKLLSFKANAILLYPHNKFEKIDRDWGIIGGIQVQPNNRLLTGQPELLYLYYATLLALCRYI